MSVIEHPHFGTLYQEGAPWQFSKSDPIDLLPTPLPNEHTDELLNELSGSSVPEVVTAARE